MGVKVGFTNCVFEILCFSENTIFIVFSANTTFQKQKLHAEKQNIYEKLWVVFEHGQMVFWGLFFWGFNVIVVCFCCVWHSSRSVKNVCLVFPSFGAFVGWFILLYFGFGRFRCFCGFCVCFCFFCVVFVFVSSFVVGFVLVLVLVLFFVFFVFFFFFFLVFCLILFLFFWRV